MINALLRSRDSNRFFDTARVGDGFRLNTQDTACRVDREVVVEKRHTERFTI